MQRAGLLGALLTIAEAAEAGHHEEVVHAMAHAHPELSLLTPSAFAELNLEAAMWSQAHEMA